MNYYEMTKQLKKYSQVIIENEEEIKVISLSVVLNMIKPLFQTICKSCNKEVKKLNHNKLCYDCQKHLDNTMYILTS